MPSCFVPGCKTAYRSCSVKANMFKAPSDPVQLEKWRQAITRSDRTLTSDDYVCRLHFAPECIERTDDADIDGIMDDPHPGYPKLVNGAVPGIFPNSPSATVRSSSDRSVCVPAKVRKVMAKQVTQDKNVSATDDSGRWNLFSELRRDSESLCPESWRSVSDGEYVCFVRLEIVSGQARFTTSVSISKDLHVGVFHGGLPVSHSFPDRVRNRDDVTTMLQQLANSRVFVGNPSERLGDMRPADPAPVDNSPELDLSTICNPDTSVTDM